MTAKTLLTSQEDDKTPLRRVVIMILTCLTAAGAVGLALSGIITLAPMLMALGFAAKILIIYCGTAVIVFATILVIDGLSAANLLKALLACLALLILMLGVVVLTKQLFVYLH